MGFCGGKRLESLFRADPILPEKADEIKKILLILRRKTAPFLTPAK
jgi:hypothetical protein